MKKQMPYRSQLKVKMQRSRLVVAILAAILVASLVSFARLFFFAQQVQRKQSRRATLAQGTSSSSSEARAPRSAAGLSFTLSPLKQHHHHDSERACQLLAKTGQVSCSSVSTQGARETLSGTLQQHLSRVGLLSIFEHREQHLVEQDARKSEHSNKNSRPHRRPPSSPSVSSWSSFVQREEDARASSELRSFISTAAATDQSLYSLLHSIATEPQCSDLSRIVGGIVVNRKEHEQSNNKNKNNNSAPLFQVLLVNSLSCAALSTTNILAASILCRRDRNADDDVVVWVESSIALEAADLLLRVTGTEMSAFYKSVADALETGLPLHVQRVTLCTLFTNSSTSGGHVTLSFPRLEDLLVLPPHMNALWADLLYQTSAQAEEALPIVETVQKRRTCIARFLLPNSNFFVAGKKHFVNKDWGGGESLLRDKYAPMLQHSLELLSSECQWHTSVDVISNSSIGGDGLQQDVHSWRDYFSSATQPTDVLISVASPSHLSIICGFFAAATSPRGAFLFAPFGSTQHDIATLETVADVCGGLLRSDSPPFILPPFLLFHRSPLEADAAFAVPNQQQQRRRTSNSQQHLVTNTTAAEAGAGAHAVLDEREAREAWIQLGSAIRSASRGKNAVAVQTNDRSGADESGGTIMLRVFGRRTFVDPDFFSIGGGAATGEEGFIVFERATHSLLFVDVNVTSLSLFRESIFSLIRRPAVPQAAAAVSPEFLLSLYAAADVRGGGLIADDALAAVESDLLELATTAGATNQMMMMMTVMAAGLRQQLKLKKKLRKLGDLRRVRFAYRHEDSDGLHDLRIMSAARGDDANNNNNHVNVNVNAAMRQLVKEAEQDEQQRQFYKTARKRDGLSKEVAQARLKELMQAQVKELNKFVMIQSSQNEQKMKSNRDGFLQCCPKHRTRNRSGGSSSNTLHFVHYPFVLDNIYHTHNDNILPLFLAAQQVHIGRNAMLCPVSVDVIDDETKSSLCSQQRRHLLLLPSTRTNKPLPAFAFIASHFFHSVVHLDPSRDVAKEAAAATDCPDVGACISLRSDTLVFGRPPRPFSADAADVARYFDAGTVLAYRRFLQLLPETRAAAERVEKTYWSVTGDGVDEGEEVRVVILERSRKRVFQSDSFFAAALATRFEQLQERNGNRHTTKNRKLRVRFATCCESGNKSFAEQSALVASCDVLVGVHGAGLLHALVMGLDLLPANRKRARRRFSSPLVVHVASRRLNYHEQTVIERLAFFAGDARRQEQQHEMILSAGRDDLFVMRKRVVDSAAAAPAAAALPVRFMTTFSVTGTQDSAQHWSDDFDLPSEEVDNIANRIVTRFFSSV